MSKFGLRMRCGRCIIGVLALAIGMPAFAGPPYRTGDADTAPAGTVGVRVGVLRMQREASINNYTGPMLRLKLALTDSLEVTSLVDYAPEEGRVSDGALAFKLVSRRDSYSVGLETVASLPVASGQSGIGLESSVLATINAQPLRFHASFGGLFDPRGEHDAHGWRSGFVAELPRGESRFGLELFARKDQGEGLQLQLGTGLVFPADRFKLRVGLHTGLTSAAPDIAATLWVTAEKRLNRNGQLAYRSNR